MTETETLSKVRDDLPAEARAAEGKDARKAVPRSSHRYLESARDRPSPLAVLARQDESRVPELVPIRYGRMLASPFSFFRGAAAIMASDLAAAPTTGLTVQLCGDAHLSNFGVFAAPDRRLVFDINDFDETLPGPFEWDVKRLAASFAVAGRERRSPLAERREWTLAALREYREAMRRFAGMRDLDVWYARLDVEGTFEQFRSHLKPKRARAFERELAKARNKDSMRALSRLSHRVNGAQRIISKPPLIVPVEELVGADAQHEVEPGLKRLLAEYQQTLPRDLRLLVGRYRYVDAARKVVGVGSVGTQAWIVLLLGRDSDDPLFLQAKEAQPSALEPYLRKSQFSHQGRRVVEGQRLMQAASDIFLGWMKSDGRDFYVRQLWDGKRSAEVELMGSSQLTIYARLCGWTLARAHARSGDRVAIASYLGGGSTFDEAVAEFAESYAAQNERDFDAVSEAAKAGAIAVQPGM